MDEDVRKGLLEYLTEDSWQGCEPPTSKWERSTCDAAFLPRTWGLQREHLQALAHSELWAKLEVQSRLCKLYPDMHLAHLPSDNIQTQPIKQQQQERSDHLACTCPATSCSTSAAAMQQQPNEHCQAAAPSHARNSHANGSMLHATATCNPATGSRTASNQVHQTPTYAQNEATATAADASTLFAPNDVADCDAEDEDEVGTSVAVDCNQFVANAAVHGDCFSWHVDADPWTFPHSEWTQTFSTYFNREPGKPLLVSLILYLNDEWQRDWDAETLFLDTQTDTGVFVRPKPYRAVLMDQDVVHRLSMPSRTATTPRYSLVWKLVFLPKTPGQACSIAKQRWGRPTCFGSAAKVDSVVKQLAGVKRQRTSNIDAGMAEAASM
eukprot:jgi/Chrzof1/13583/Cz08g03060.t1